MKITAVGDCALQKRLPKYYDGFEEVRDYIMQGDVRFFNLETTVCEDCYPGKYSGGTWLRTEPEVLRDALDFGFNVTTPANNHCMDFSYEGFLQTLDNIKAVGLPSSGGGRTLAEATAPAYIDTPAGRAAVISCTSSYSYGAEAGEQSRDLRGRPGINPLRTEQVIYLPREEFDQLSAIADKVGLNDYNNILVKEGYRNPPKEGVLDFCKTEFRIGEPKITYRMNQEDLDRIKTAIRDARFQADIVLISIHSHNCEKGDKEAVPDFLADFCHMCIDAGAHAVLGHGPHLLRPLEIYKGFPIFYSLGDFILHLENGKIIPDDYYRKYGLTPDAGVYEVFRKRTRDFTVGLQRQSVMMEAVIPFFEFEGGVLKELKLLPVELGLGKPHSQIGWPRVKWDGGILERYAEMSAPFGTVILPDGTVKLS